MSNTYEASFNSYTSSSRAKLLKGAARHLRALVQGIACFHDTLDQQQEESATITHNWAIDLPEEGQAQCTRCSISANLFLEDDKWWVLYTHDGDSLDINTADSYFSDIDFDEKLDSPRFNPCNLWRGY